MNTVVLVVELDLKPDHRESFLARARQHRENVLKNEPDCKQFEVQVAEDDVNKIFLYEVYADQAAVDHHMNTPYMKAYREDTGAMIADRRLVKCSRPFE